MLDSIKIREILPHSYPFLLVDKIKEITETKIIGIKNVTINEPFFEGHFKLKPIMPGVLIVESLAQTGAILLLSKEKYKNKIVLFTGIEKFKFRKQVTPGDTLKLEIKMINLKLNVGKAEAIAKIEDETIVAEGIISFAVEM